MPTACAVGVILSLARNWEPKRADHDHQGIAGFGFRFTFATPFLSLALSLALSLNDGQVIRSRGGHWRNGGGGQSPGRTVKAKDKELLAFAAEGDD